MPSPIRPITYLTLKHGGLWKVRDVFIVGAPELVAEVLRDGKRFGKGGKLLAGIARYVGPTNLFTTDDDTMWRAVHEPIAPYFARTQLPSLVELAAEVWTKQIRGWDTRRPVPTYHAHSTFSVELLMRYAFGNRLDDCEIVDTVDAAFAVFTEMARCVPASLFSDELARRFDHGAREQLERLVIRIIDRTRTQPGDDLVSALLAAQQTNPRITDTVIRDQVFGLLVAGFDSMSAVFSLAIRHLATHPEEFQALRREVSSVLPDRRQPRFDDLDQLPAVRVFVTRMTALNPAFPLVPLCARNDTTLGGVPIPGGATIVVNLHAQAKLLHARGAHYGEDGGPSRYLSYGAGKRQCLALHMSQLLLELTTTMLLQHATALTLPLRARIATNTYAVTLSAPARGAVLIHRNAPDLPRLRPAIRTLASVPAPTERVIAQL